MRQSETIFRQWEVGPSWSLPFFRQFKTIWAIFDNSRQFKTIGSRPIVGVAFLQTIQDSLRQFKTIQDNLRQFKTIYDHWGAIRDNLRQWEVGPSRAFPFFPENIRQFEKI